jgi:hypothetical protein
VAEIPLLLRPGQLPKRQSQLRGSVGDEAEGKPLGPARGLFESTFANQANGSHLWSVPTATELDAQARVARKFQTLVRGPGARPSW